MKRVSIFLAALAIGGLVGGTRGGDKTERPLDDAFLVKVASAHHAEIEISKLADKRAASSKVKTFADTIVKEHKSAYQEMAKLLKNRKIGVVTGLEKDTRDEVARLGKLEGSEFDRAFLHCMVKEHKNAITIFENQAKNGKEDDIRAYAKDMLPHLRDHLKQAKELAKSTDK